MATGVDRTHAVTVEAELHGLRAAPVRIALGVLSIGTALWAGLVVAVPVALLVGILILPVPPVIGVQIVLFLVFVFWANGGGYNRKRTTVDPDAGTVSIDRPSGFGQRKTDVHELDAVDAVAIQRVGPVALVTIRSDASLMTASRFVVSASELPQVRDALLATDVRVVESGIRSSADGSARDERVDLAGAAGASDSPPIGPRARLGVTLLVVLGVPIATLVAFGPGPVGVGAIWVVMVGGITLIGGGLLRLLADG